MSYVFGDYKPVMGVPVGGMDPYDPVNNPYGLQQVESQPPPPPIQMQGSGLPSLGDPGPYGFTPQPTGGPEQLAGLMAMQQAQFGPILAGPPATDTGTGTGTGTDTTEETIVEPDDVEDPPTTPVDVTEPVYTDPTLEPYYDQEAVQNLINDYINNNSQNIIEDWMRNNPEGIGSLDLGQYGIYDDYYNQDQMGASNTAFLQDYLANNPTDYSNYYNQDQMDASNTAFLQNYLANNPTDYSNYYNQDQMDASNTAFLQNYLANNPTDYSGYYDQAYIDNLLQGINGLRTPNPGARTPLIQE